MIFLIILYLILFVVLSWRRIDWAVFLILATLPSYLIRFNILSIPFTLLEAMILISFSVWFLKSYKEVFGNIKSRLKNYKLQTTNYKPTRYPFDWEIVLVLVVSFIAVGVAGFSDSAFGIWKAYFFEPLLFYILVINVFGKKIDRVVWPLAVSALGVSLVAIYQYITGDLIFNEFWANEANRRAVSVFGYPNAVGLYLAPIVMLIVGLFFEKFKKIDFSLKIFRTTYYWQLLFLAVTTALSIRATMFADSEGALVGLAAGLFVFGILANKKLRWVTIIFTILISAGLFFYQPVRTKVIDKVTLMDLSGQIRKAQWNETWEMLKDGRIFIGSGLANYKQTVEPYHAEGIFVCDPHDPDWHRKTVWNEEFRNSVWQPLEIYMYPHNIFLNFWVELGLAGMILFIWIIGKFLYLGLKNINKKSKNRYFTLGLVCAMMVIVVHGLVDVPYLKNDLAVLFWLIVAMMGVVNLKVRSEKQ